MQEISSTFNQIIRDFADLKFASSDHFYWRPEDRTIFHPAIKTSQDLYLILHEISHARMAHTKYRSDIRLVDMEREAWRHAIDTLVPHYGLSIHLAEQIAQESLDSYRDWMHQRSTCPNCQAVGIESSASSYRCLACNQQWRVNEARSCQLRRYKK